MAVLSHRPKHDAAQTRSQVREQLYAELDEALIASVLSHRIACEIEREFIKDQQDSSHHEQAQNGRERETARNDTNTWFGLF